MTWEFQTIAKLTTALLLHYYKKLWTKPLFVTVNFNEYKF